MNKQEMQDTVTLKGEVTLEFRNVKTGKIRKYVYRNMVLTNGKKAIAQALRGRINTNITYCAVGTSAVAPALADTGLTAELFRKLISVREDEDNVSIFTTFYTTSEANGVLREAALFGNSSLGDASATADSGTCFCKLAINRTKSSNDTLTLTWKVIIG